MANDRAIFLDFDGVLHAVDDVQLAYSATGLAFQGEHLLRHLPLLAELLAPHPDVRLVIASSWRQHCTLEELRAMLGVLGNRVIATTRSADQIGEPPANRFQECVIAAERLGIARWILIDDHPGVVWCGWTPTPAQQRQVIFCDPSLGLATHGVCDRVASWLRSGHDGY